MKILQCKVKLNYLQDFKHFKYFGAACINKKRWPANNSLVHSQAEKLCFAMVLQLFKEKRNFFIKFNFIHVLSSRRPAGTT